MLVPGTLLFIVALATTQATSGHKDQDTIQTGQYEWNPGEDNTFLTTEFAEYTQVCTSNNKYLPGPPDITLWFYQHPKGMEEGTILWLQNDYTTPPTTGDVPIFTPYEYDVKTSYNATTWTPGSINKPSHFSLNCTML